jgi:PKD domain/Bacterial Ig-like domain (group 3)
MLFVVAILISSITGPTNYQTRASALQFPTASGSWNSRVPCSSPWIVRITDITDNKTGSASLSSSTFSPGITSPVGSAKRWLTPGSTPPGWVSPGPPCMITNSHGQVATFVQIDGVKRGTNVSTEDCTGKYDTVNGGTSNGGTFCDETFNIYDPALVPNYSTSCTSSTDPTCYSRIHSEIDHDWNAAKYCGASTACDNVTLSSQTTTSTLIDVQGFISWDPGHLNNTWHNLNGWEIHPLTGWRVHQSNSSLTATFSFSPSSPATGQSVTLTASATEGVSPYTFGWSFGDGSSATGNPTTHVYSGSGSYTVTLTVHDSVGQSAAVSQIVTVASAGDFKLSANPSNLTVQQGQNSQSVIAVTSIGFQGTVSLSTSVSSPGLTVSLQNPSVNLSPGQTQNDNLKISATSTTLSGIYIITVKGTSGSLIHSLNVTVTVPPTDFSLAANPDLLTVQLGQNTQSQIVVKSVSGFSGTVSFTTSISSPGLTVSMEHPTVSLSPGQTQNDNLRVSASNTSPTGVYVVTVKGTSGLLAHSLNVTVRVPDFNMTANPTTLDISPGSTGSSQVTFHSVDGFQGGISTQVSVSPAGPKVTLNPNNPNLQANGTVTIALSIQLASNQAPGVYNVTIKATAGALLHLLVVKVLVGQHTSSTSVSCSPSSVIVNQASTCTATVIDTSTGTVTTPTGTATFTETGPAGSFSQTTCTLVSGSCSVAFTPTATGNALVTGTYAGDSSHSGSTSAPTTVVVNQRTTSTDIVCSGPVVVNQASSCTATVSDTSPGTVVTPTGSVNFTETGVAGSFSSATCVLTSGSCSVTFTARATGTASITGAYDADSAHDASTSAAASVTVNPRTTSNTVVCTSPVVANQGSNCTATITDSSGNGSVTPIGNVTFVSNSLGSFSATSCKLAAVSTGVAGCGVSYTPGVTGSHLITGSYSGDAVHSASSGAFTVTVGQRSTSTTVGCVTTALGVNQACTATVSDNSPGTVITPTGGVSFTTNSTGTFSSNSCTLSGTGTPGVASCQVTYTPVAVGTHTITGVYSGDTIHLASQGFASIGFGKDSTATTINCSPSSVAINQATTCNVTVTDTATIGATTPTGTVNFASSGSGSFTDSKCTLVNQTVTSSSCQVTYTPTSGAGTHTIASTYSGDGTHNGSTSSSFALAVTLRTTSTSVSCATSVMINQGSTCNATVTDTSAGTFITPTGTVALNETGTAGTFTTCTLAGSTASATCSSTFTATASGTASVTASYPGDAAHSSSNSTASIVVNLRTTSTTISCSPSSVVVNQTTSCTAIVADSSGSGAITPTGNVVFTPGGTCTLVSGSCSVNIMPFTSGSLTVSASYSGDSSHSTSSGSTTVPVGKRATSTSVFCSPSPVTNSTVTSCVVKVTDADVGAVITPSGSVGFASNSTGTFAQLNCTLAATETVGVASCSINYTPGATGSHLITASYPGDSTHLGSSGSVVVTVVGSAPPPAPSYALVVSTDGKVSRLYQNGTLTLVGQPVTTPLRSVAWKPDGSYALISGDFAVLIKYDGATLTTIPTGISTGFNFWTVSWKPDASYALVGGSAGMLFKYDGVKVTIIPNTSATFFAITWNPSGAIALLAGRTGLVMTYDGTTLRSFASGTTFDLDTAAWSPNGQYALIGGLNRTLLQFNGTGITAINTSLINPNNAIRGIAFNPTGTMALLVGDKGMVLAYNGSTLTMLTTVTSSVLYAISWSSSGTAYILGNSGTVLSYSNGTLTKLTTNPLSTSNFRAIAWKP